MNSRKSPCSLIAIFTVTILIFTSPVYASGVRNSSGQIIESSTSVKEKTDTIRKTDKYKITSIGTHRNFGWMDGHTLDFEGFFGIRIDASDSSKPKYSVYTHNPMFVCKSIEFNGSSLTDMTVDEWYPP